uniref:Uncharacterized protein n=1 Tax=viral metagenome TaxID=1070528 RepID=A0A6C0B1I0_9ZZZZ
MDRLSTSTPALTQSQSSFLPSSLSSITTTGASTTTGPTFLNLSLTTWIIIILVLAILGINIFAYLAKGTQTFASFFSPIFQKITYLFGNSLGNVTKQVTDTAATGTTAGVDIIAGTIDSGVDVTSQIISGAPASSSIVGSQKTSTNNTIPTNQNDSLTQTLNQAQKMNPTTQGNSGSSSSSSSSSTSNFSADDATSAIQSSKTSSKSGWCYIGEDRGFRSCIQVGENDHCMSGDIFPSQDICVNPTLRQ